MAPYRTPTGVSPAVTDAAKMRRLVQAVQDLSKAHDLEGVAAVVRTAARGLTGADGATFVLRDGDHCFYADEDAIAPLWKGQRFRMEDCVSGWVMHHGRSVVIPDIYADERVLHAAYRPTFVRSMAMVPIRPGGPVGAIGIYWARHHVADEEEVEVIQALANAASITLENVRLVAELESRVERRTAELRAANEELKAFTHAASHDLRGPLRTIDGFAALLAARHGSRLTPEGRDLLDRLQGGSRRLGELLESLLEFSRLGRSPVERTVVSMDDLAREAAAEVLASEGPGRSLRVEVEPGLPACQGDPTLLRQVLRNLLGNAARFTRGRAEAVVRVSGRREGTASEYTVADNGIGFPAEDAGRLFAPFTTLHGRGQSGTGLGLSIVRRIVEHHGGAIRAEGRMGEGASFTFTIPDAAAAPAPGLAAAEPPVPR